MSAFSRLHPRLHHPAARAWQEPQLHPSQFTFPIFVTTRSEDKEIPGFAPNKQWGRGTGNVNSGAVVLYNSLILYLEELVTHYGLTSVMLFGVVEDKDAAGSKAWDDGGPVPLCIKSLRQHFQERLLIMADVCLCEYTSHGHCGVLCNQKKMQPWEKTSQSRVDNDSTLEHLVEAAVCYAKAGAHWVCPSDMMDGRIGAIRDGLDKSNFQHVGIMSYTSKKASCLYSPFRQAVDSTFKGDRKQYQQPVGSATIPRAAYDRDVREGADIVLVKPSLMYTDIIREFSGKSITVAAYVVSGEYKMLYDYGQNCNCLAEVVQEAHVSLLRAGASMLVTYFAPYILKELIGRKPEPSIAASVSTTSDSEYVKCDNKRCESQSCKEEST